MDTHNEIITLRKEIAALRWVIYHRNAGVWRKDEREEYKQDIEAIERKTKELEDES